MAMKWMKPSVKGDRSTVTNFKSNLVPEDRITETKGEYRSCLLSLGKFLYNCLYCKPVIHA